MQSATQVEGKICIPVRSFATNLFIMASIQLQPAHRHEQCRSSMVVSSGFGLLQLAAMHSQTMSCKYSSKHSKYSSKHSNSRPSQIMSCKHNCKHNSKPNTHSSLSEQAYICSQLTTTSSFAVAGTVKSCHATTAAYSYHYVHCAPSRSGPIQLIQ